MGLTEPPADLCCTSLPQQWGKPRGQKIKPVPVPQMVIVKPKLERKRKPLTNTITDNRKVHVEESDIDYLSSLKGYPISYLAHKTAVKFDTPFGSFPLGSTLSTQAILYAQKERVQVGTTCGDLVLPKKDVVHGVLSVEHNSLVNSITHEYATGIEEKTRAQANSSKWFEERKTRITASNFHKIVKRKMAVTDKFVHLLMNPKSFHSKATSYGKNSESKAREQYVSTSGNHVHDCGLVVNPLFSIFRGKS